MRLPLVLLILLSLAGPVASADRLDVPREHVDVPFTDCNVNNDHSPTEVEVACVDETGFGFAVRQGPHTDEVEGETGYRVVAGTYEGGQRSAQVLCADIAVNSARC